MLYMYYIEGLQKEQFWSSTQSIPKSILYDSNDNKFRCATPGIPLSSNAQALTQ